MKDGKPNHEAGAPERRGATADRRAPATGRTAQERGRGWEDKEEPDYIERATAHGHSGHGSESVRPHLRDQLRLKALLPTPFPTPPEARHEKDGHHL